MGAKGKIEIDKKFMMKIKRKYSPIPENDFERSMESTRSLISFAQTRGRMLKDILDQANKIIFRNTTFREVSIGLKSEDDELFRFVVFLGLGPAAKAAHSSVAYTLEEMYQTDKYPGIMLSETCEYCISEGVEYEEIDIKMFNRPSILAENRKLGDEFLEGDYIDFLIYGRAKNLLGWVEVGRAQDGKLPPRVDIRFIELIALVLGVIIEQFREKDLRFESK